MGLWSRWEEVLDAYRDVNRLFGDIIKVTPSSKCVGDLALYLVTCNVKAQDVLDPLKAKDIDFPESVVGLLKGDLGFPHRGFPLPVEEAILKGETKRTQRAGVMLAPVDFVQNLITLTTRWCSEAEGFPGETISAEQAMSSLMYPKVFDDYMKRRRGKGRALRYLPTPVYFYAMSPGQKFNMLVPAEILVDVTKTAATSPDQVNVSIELIRVCPLKEGKRKVIFSVNGIEQHFDVKDTSGAFIFEGEMADPKVIDQVGSPMPGLVEKLLVVSGQKVAAGDTLCTISAMKMEVKVTAPRSGTVALVSVSLAARVVEGALLITII
jgi:pyruvate carboxylase